MIGANCMRLCASWPRPIASRGLRALTLTLGLSGGLVMGQEARIEPFGAAFGQVEAANASQTRVYAYRPAQSLNPAPVNLYLNARYHTSLLRGGFTEFCLSPGRLTVQSALDDASQLHLGKTLAGLPLDAQAGRTVFLRVADGAGVAPQVLPVPESQAIDEIRLTRRQQHTVSRAAEVKPCMPAAPVAEAPKPQPTPAVAPPTRPQKDFTLAADALFVFGKSKLRPSGEEAVENLAKQVLQEYQRIDRIQVTGYTDAIGPAQLNLKLSKERALTVARLLDQYGLHPSRGYKTDGRGSAELARIGCKNKPTPENKACHAPNRRVVISITGTRK